MPRDLEAKRRYDAAWAARRRARRLAAKNAGATTCQRGIGAHMRCGGTLETITDGNGRTSVVCPLCERRKAGICRECPRPVSGTIGKAIRCAEHKLAATRRYAVRYKRDNLLTIRAKAKRRARSIRGAAKVRRNELRRLWRIAHPEAVKAYRRSASPRASEHRKQYLREWHQKNRDYRNRRAQEREAGTASPRLCVAPGCDIVVTGRKKKCTKCRQRDKEAARAMLASIATPRRRKSA